MNHPLISAIEENYKKKNIPDPKPGDVVRVHQIIKEGDKERVQVFEGVVIKRQHGTELGATFTVRKIAVGGIGVERTYQLHSPTVVKVERVKSSHVRHAKLLYLRNTKSSRIRLHGEKADAVVWEEPEAEKELEKIKEEQEKEADIKAQEKAHEEEELEKKFHEARGEAVVDKPSEKESDDTIKSDETPDKTDGK